MENQIEIKEDYFSNEEENNNNNNNNINNNNQSQNNNDNNKINSTNSIISSNDTNNNNNNISTNSEKKPEILTIQNLNPETIKLNIPPNLHKIKEQENEKATELQIKTKKNKELKFENFFKQNRHYLIMTDGGKPVYSRFGDEIENSTIFATLSAIVTKFSCFISTEKNKEELNVISNENSKIVFLKKGQLIFISISKKNDSVSLLITQLEFLYQQLMSILTIHFYEKLEDNPSKCLTAMSDTEILFEQMIQYTKKSMVSILNSFQVLPFENREQLNKICELNRGEALMCIIMTSTQILGISYNSQINLLATDIILVQNLIFSWESLRTTESWVPICLPGISEDGYLQLYCKFTEENIGVCFLTEKMDSEYFMKFMNQNNQIYDALLQQNLIQKILKSIPIKKQNENEHLLEDSPENNKQLINLLLTKIIQSNPNLSKSKKNLLQNVNSLSPFETNRNETLFQTQTLKNLTSSTPNKLNRGNTIFAPNLIPDKMDNLNDIFDNVIYGLCKSKKLNQFFTINFTASFRLQTKEEKLIIKKYINLYEKINNYNNNEKCFFFEKGDYYTHAIEQNENFILICSFNFFMNFDEIGQKMLEILKFIKKNEKKYFILFK